MIALSLFGREPLIGVERGRNAIRSLIAIGPELTPTGYFQPPRRAVKRVTEPEIEVSKASDQAVVFIRETGGITTGSVALLDGSGYSHFFAEIPDELFRDPKTRSKILQFSLDLMVKSKGISGYSHDEQDFSLQNERNADVFRVSGASLRGYRMKTWSLSREIDVERNPGHHHFVAGKMFTVAWANFFGPEMVELIGRERILGAEWHSVTEADGQVMALLYEDPSNPGDRERRKRQARVRAQLALDDIAHAEEKRTAGA